MKLIKMTQNIHWWLMVFMLLEMPVHAAILRTVSLQSTENQTTVQCTIDKNTTYHFFTLENPHRVVLDLSNTQLKASLNPIPSNGIVKHVRAGPLPQHGLRLVFDLYQAANVRTTSHDQILRLILTPKTLQNAIHLPIKSQKILSIKRPQYAIPPLRQHTLVVVIDPGHGGKDPGARGPGGAREKHVVLAIAKTLKRIIDRQPGMRAILTRNGDYYIELRDRLRLARKYNADIFISIHADAFSNHASRGASVYALSQMGATSEAAHWLAEKENYSELGGVNLSRLHDNNGVLRSVLIDLSQTATIRSSLDMGTCVLHHLDHLTDLHHQRVEQARFMVLKSPDIPSLLIETGFISNPVEEKNLKNPAYQQKLTAAIFAGIQQYVRQYPLQSTAITAN